MNKPANISDLGLKIDTHLCTFCTHQFVACDSIQYLYGTGDGDISGVPNVCACDGFDPKIAARPERRAEIKRPEIESLRAEIKRS